MSRKTAKCRRPAPVTRRAAKTELQPWNPIMYLNPLGSVSGFSFGVLRTSYAGKANSASAFVKAKLHPVSLPAAAAAWAPTAHRWEVLLPPDGGDDLLDPRRLIELFEATALPWRQGLLTTVKLNFGEADRLHAAYEKGRAWLRSLVRSRGLPAIIIQHCPHEAGLEYRRHHLHILIVPRSLGIAGFGACDDELTSDAGQRVLYSSWSSFEE
ncbi:MAG: hypothetical protein ABIW83_07970 [Allosphingosinicella sp.]